MTIPSGLRKSIRELADIAKSARYLNKRILQICDLLDIDVDNPDFVAAFSFVEGDCDTTQIFSYLESL